MKKYKQITLLAVITIISIFGITGCTKGDNKESEKQIKSVINEYNETLKEAYNGKEAKNNKELFSDDNIFKESDARSEIISEYYSMADVKSVEQTIDYTSIDIKSEYAKAITEIKVNVSDEKSKVEKPNQINRHETYILKKTDKKWKIHSIIEAEFEEKNKEEYDKFIKEEDFVKYGNGEGKFYRWSDSELKK